MEQNIALQIIQQVILASGVLIGLLVVFLGMVPQRKRGKIDLFLSSFYRLEQRKIDVVYIDKNQKNAYLKEIAAQQAIISGMIAKLQTSIHVGGIPINVISYGHLIYLVGIFVISIFYFLFVSVNNQINDGMVYGSVIALCIGYCFLVPVTYWTSVKEYDLGNGSKTT